MCGRTLLVPFCQISNTAAPRLGTIFMDLDARKLAPRDPSLPPLPQDTSVMFAPYLAARLRAQGRSQPARQAVSRQSRFR